MAGMLDPSGATHGPPAWVSRERLSILSHATRNAPLHTPHDDNDTHGVHAASSACATSKPARGGRIRDPEHYCAFKKCCYKFYNQGALLAKDIEHLPVCHSYCWRLELERLWRHERGGDGGPRALWLDLWFCHRQCYMQSLLKAHDLNRGDKKVVPENRSIGERLGMPMLEHYFEWRQPRSSRLQRYTERLLGGPI